MTTRLIALTGPLQGTSYELGDTDVTIGRSHQNQICISDYKVSRQHCSIRCEGDRFRVIDLQSHNGVLVNGTRVVEQSIESGDRIEIGGYIFLFSRGEEQSPRVSGIYLEDAIESTHSTTRSAERPAARSGVIEFLLKITAALSVARTVPSVSDRSARGILEGLLLELLFEVIPAERGAVVITESGSSEPSAVFTRERGDGKPGPVRVSRTVVRQVLEQRSGLLMNLGPSSTMSKDLESVAGIQGCASDSGRASVLAAPLLVSDWDDVAPHSPARALGVIYLQSGSASFDESHLELITEVSVVASVAFENALYMETLRKENELLQAAVRQEHHMIGHSAPMRELSAKITKVAKTDSTVLIMGESGTGKELVARAIHEDSPRAAKRFVAINCAALTETLLESELFGHEKGSFTGATGQKLGKLEMAENGTVFLDEIGEMPLHLQAKVLRVLQEREFERVGGTRTLKLNIRVLAATNRDLLSEVHAGRFREDLYYRLAVVTLRIPSLRERGDDILILARHFAARHSAICNRKFAGFTPKVERLMSSYDWPGNVRELENAVERAIVLGSGGRIREEDLPESLFEAVGPDAEESGESLQSIVHASKHKAVANALAQSGGSVTGAAKLLGVNSNYLHRLMNNLKLR